jgi:hypothetical protein
MSDTPVKELTDTERAALFTTWLKPLAPDKPPRESIVAKIAPWRHQFIEARQQGFSWAQLAKEVASKSEIGLKISPGHLKNCVAAAYEMAGEKMANGKEKTRKRHRNKKPAAATATAAAPTAGTTAAAAATK